MVIMFGFLYCILYYYFSFSGSVTLSLCPCQPSVVYSFYSKSRFLYCVSETLFSAHSFFSFRLKISTSGDALTSSVRLFHVSTARTAKEYSRGSVLAYRTVCQCQRYCPVLSFPLICVHICICIPTVYLQKLDKDKEQARLELEMQRRRERIEMWRQEKKKKEVSFIFFVFSTVFSYPQLDFFTRILCFLHIAFGDFFLGQGDRHISTNFCKKVIKQNRIKHHSFFVHFRFTFLKMRFFSCENLSTNFYQRGKKLLGAKGKAPDL